MALCHTGVASNKATGAGPRAFHSLPKAHAYSTTSASAACLAPSANTGDLLHTPFHRHAAEIDGTLARSARMPSGNGSQLSFVSLLAFFWYAQRN